MKRFSYEGHVGFQVKIARANLLSCTHLVPQLSITMENHTVTEDFFVVDLDDMEVILGIYWMETLDEYTQSFKWMEFSFELDGKKVVLRGMSNGELKEILAQQMESILRHDIWAAQFFI